MVLKQFNLTFVILLLSEIYWNEGNSCCFTVSEGLACIDVFEQIWFELCMVINTIERYSLILIDLDVMGVQESKNSSNYLTRFSIDLDGLWSAVETCWCRLMNPMLSWSRTFNIQGRKPYFFDFVENMINVGLYSDIHWLISFKFGVMIETTKHQAFWHQFGWTWPSFKVTFS